LQPGDAGSEVPGALNLPCHFGQTKKWRVIDSGNANGRLQEEAKVYSSSMVKVILPESFELSHHLKGHREPQQRREGKQNGSP
jgi:hypothetical protein